MATENITPRSQLEQTDRLSIGKLPIGPLPQGLSGWWARVADRNSNHADRRNLPWCPALTAALEADLPGGLLLADMHTDTLLWGVDPLAFRESGHVDVPRLREARVGLQIFGGPTWTPLPMKNREQALCVSCESIDQSDALFPAQILDRVRREKGILRRRRAHRLAERFHQMIEADAGKDLRPIYSASDLEGLRHSSGEGPIGVMLSLEGIHWIEPDASAHEVEEEIASLRAAGYRMLALTHRFSNGLGGSSEDCHGRQGLTAAGRAAVRACFEQGIAVDLAHASPALIREAAGLALNETGGSVPLIISHGGVRRSHRVARNLRDADIRAVASTGGVIGIGVWWEAIGFDLADLWETKLARITDAFAAALAALKEPEFVEEMEDRFGRYDPYEHLAIGSDFDGATATPYDVTGLSWQLADLLARTDAEGAPLFPLEKLPLIAGGNTLRVLGKILARG
ncbi:MAG: membrane dipeptidase [Neomegalonema sp.]|nr:membrane dipeptidase [Neomegalonema sp.]